MCLERAIRYIYHCLIMKCQIECVESVNLAKPSDLCATQPIKEELTAFNKKEITFFHLLEITENLFLNEIRICIFNRSTFHRLDSLLAEKY